MHVCTIRSNKETKWEVLMKMSSTFGYIKYPLNVLCYWQFRVTTCMHAICKPILCQLTYVRYPFLVKFTVGVTDTTQLTVGGLTPGVTYTAFVTAFNIESRIAPPNDFLGSAEKESELFTTLPDSKGNPSKTFKRRVEGGKMDRLAPGPVAL